MQLTSIEKKFQESHDLQSGLGVGDLASAVKGYDFLARERRGPAWPGHALADTDSDKDRVCWGGDRRRESDAGTVNASYNSGGWENDGMGWLESFLATKDGDVHEFFTRSRENFALVTAEVRGMLQFGMVAPT